MTKAPIKWGDQDAEFVGTADGRSASRAGGSGSAARSDPPGPRERESPSPGPARIDQSLDGDGITKARGSHVIVTGEPGEEGDDADPATHGRSIGWTPPGALRTMVRAGNEASQVHTAGGTMYCREASDPITTVRQNR